MRVVVYSDYYPPGYKAGGPPVTISRIVASEALAEILVVTRDRDMGDKDPYPGLRAPCIVTRNEQRVAFLRPGLRDWVWAVAKSRSWKSDIVYVNSLQSPWFGLLPLLLHRAGVLRGNQLLLAPRGQCSPGAQSIKARKKSLAKPFIKFLIGPKVTWHASSVRELRDISDWWGADLPNGHKTIVRANPAPPPEPAESLGSGESIPVLVFASRIDRMKGLDCLLEALGSVEHAVRLMIYGVIQDEAYWRECQALLGALPANIDVTVGGPYEPSQALGIYRGADLFILPTHGENFGQSIAEALSVGCPVAISPHTLWTEVATTGMGYVATSASDFAEAIRHFCMLDPSERRLARRHAIAAYREWYAANEDATSLFEMLE